MFDFINEIIKVKFMKNKFKNAFNTFSFNFP